MENFELQIETKRPNTQKVDSRGAIAHKTHKEKCRSNIDPAWNNTHCHNRSTQHRNNMSHRLALGNTRPSTLDSRPARPCLRIVNSIAQLFYENTKNAFVTRKECIVAN
jgi:hypothetical protein